MTSPASIHEHLPVRREGEAILGDWRPQDIAGQTRAVRSSAATVMAAWRSKPSRCAWHGPREVTQGAPASDPESYSLSARVSRSPVVPASAGAVMAAPLGIQQLIACQPVP